VKQTALTLYIVCILVQDLSSDTAKGSNENKQVN